MISLCEAPALHEIWVELFGPSLRHLVGTPCNSPKLIALLNPPGSYSVLVGSMRACCFAPSTWCQILALARCHAFSTARQTDPLAPASISHKHQPASSSQKLKPKNIFKKITESHILNNVLGESAAGRWKLWIHPYHSLSRCHCDTARSGSPGYMRCNPCRRLHTCDPLGSHQKDMYLTGVDSDGHKAG